MIKNIVFDIGNVILNFDFDEVLSKYTDDIDDRKFIMDNIINSPEWMINSLIDTGYVTREDAIEIIKDRTNHIKDDIVTDFLTTYNDYAGIDKKVLECIKGLKNKGYNVYLLSNINPYTHHFIEKACDLFNIVDGYVLSYLIHQIKPFESIYKTLLDKYNLKPEECLFIDDRKTNIDTSIKLGFIGKLVEPDNYESIISVLKECKVL